MADAALERLLTRAAADLTYPPAPPLLRARVTRAVAAQPTAALRRVLVASALALAAVVAVVVASLLTVPSSRSAIADFFGIEGSQVERLPSPPPSTTPTPLPTPADIRAFGTPSSLAEAERSLGIDLALPAGLGAPEAVYLMNDGEPVAVLHYPQFDLWQGRLEFGQRFFKELPSDTIIHDLTVSGEPARWITAGTHIVRFIDASGREVAGSQRSVDRSTLIWRTDAAFYRIETDLTLDETVAIAESLP